MPRLTNSLPDDLHQALREAAARRGVTMGSIVADSLAAWITRASSLELVRQAQARSVLEGDAALTLAVGEARADRQARFER